MSATRGVVSRILVGGLTDNLCVQIDAAINPGNSGGPVFDPATGAITWTPDAADVAQGSFSLVLTVDDGDGGTAAEAWTVTVSAADADGDGLSDDWENANGLNPNDPTDAGLDPDGPS